MWPLNVIAAAGAKVTLSPFDINDTQGNPNDTRAAFIMGNDGLTYQELTIVATRTQINAATDWLRPASAASALYEVFVSNVGDALEAGSDALDTWLTLDVERSWSVLNTGNNSQTLASLTVQVRYLGGAPLDSVTGALSAVTGNPP